MQSLIKNRNRNRNTQALTNYSSLTLSEHWSREGLLSVLLWPGEVQKIPRTQRACAICGPIVHRYVDQFDSILLVSNSLIKLFRLCWIQIPTYM